MNITVEADVAPAPRCAGLQVPETTATEGWAVFRDKCGGQEFSSVRLPAAHQERLPRVHTHAPADAAPFRCASQAPDRTVQRPARSGVNPGDLRGALRDHQG
jgi:hypothetical protein